MKKDNNLALAAEASDTYNAQLHSFATRQTRRGSAGTHCLKESGS
jgi:hypothetical protein